MVMVNLDQLRIFQAVAQSRSFTRAAAIVHLTQPGISKHIRQMEEYFGVPLFDRTGRKVTLTEAGAILFEATQGIMAIIDVAEQRIDDLKGLRGGRLRLGTSFPIGVYLLPAVLAQFRKLYPAVEVKLDIAVSESIGPKILANEIDLGLVSYEPHDPRLEARAFMTDELVVIVARDHGWRTKRRIKPQELGGETIIVAARGAGTRTVVEERLNALGIVLQNVLEFGNLEGVKVIRNGTALPEHDAELPLMSLPHVLGATPETMPRGVPYLSAQPARVEAWAKRLPVGQFRVGIVWQGKSTADIDLGRSIPLRSFAPLCHIPGLTLISLQKNDGVEQLAHLPPGMTVETLGAEFDAGSDAFVDCAAVMMNLDLVISSDTAAAHLAGALGRPVWIVLKHVPDWRWMMDREDTPWYPTARLFRQARRDDWGDVFERIAAELARAAAGKTNPGDLLPQERADNFDPTQAVPPGTALVPVSFGELVDKITILEIKSERIDDASKLVNVRVELELLATALARFCILSPRAGELKAELRRINEALWEIEDQIRDCERNNDFGAKFVELARGVYLTNDRRSAVKRQLNELAGSVIVEEKSYAGSR